MPGQCKIWKSSTPGTGKAGKCPAVARVGGGGSLRLSPFFASIFPLSPQKHLILRLGGGGGSWAQLELTDALSHSNPLNSEQNYNNNSRIHAHNLHVKMLDFGPLTIRT